MEQSRACSVLADSYFLSYYLTDTYRENECLRVIPGTHRKCHQRPGPEIQAIDDLSHPAFADNSNAVDVPVKAGDLIILDARLIHATWPNQTDQRHTLLLGPVNIHAKQMMVHTKLSLDMN